LSPESINYLDVAERQLAQAERALKAELFEMAAREAYLVALSATRAIIFEKTGNAPKTHSGARTQLSKLIRDGLAIDAAFMSFLASGFEIKSDVDYGPVTPIRKESAEHAIAKARQFLVAAKAVLVNRR
jgi:uncharacterized protein (UPF0332 family)